MRHSKFFLTGVLLSAWVSSAVAAEQAADIATTSGAAKQVTVAVRRLTESEYRHSIADIFGPTIKINARFEPERREEGLLAIGSTVLSLTSSGFEQYFALAGSIADQVLGENNRSAVVPCEPMAADRADESCTRKFIERYGELLFRRPLSNAEIASRLETASAGTKQTGDFHAGLKLALTSLLVAPEFLFRIETAEPDPDHAGQYRLDAHTKAARLSFLVWDSTPDAELLGTARSGAIHSDSVLKQQLQRLVSSPRFDAGARAFFTDMLQLDGFDNLVKDAAIYPKFNQAVSDSAKEQMLKATVDLLVHKQADYRTLFTSNETFINRPLASIYNVPYPSADEWTRYTFSNSSGRSGILTDVGFLSLFAHPGTSSPTRRGIKVLEIFLCQATPNPPANVDFSKVQDSTKGTVRGRLLDHMENEGCSGCHKRTDPIGLALEHFDGLGQHRTVENGVPIDVSADLKEIQIEGAQGLGQYLHDNPRTAECLVRNVYSYGVGAKTYGRDRPYLSAQTRQFAEKGYRLPELFVQIASTPEFFKVNLPPGAPAIASTKGAGTALAQRDSQ